MAKKNQALQDAHTANIIKVGKPRRSKRKKGNPPAKTSRCGNGTKIRGPR